MERKVTCPWCDETVAPVTGLYKGEHGTIKEDRCPKCKSLIDARLQDEKKIKEID